MQQSLTEAWQDFDKIKGQNEQQLAAWLRCILLNNLRDATRAYFGTAKRDASCELSLPEENAQETWPGLAFVAGDPSPSACASANEERSLVRHLLTRIPQHYAEIIRLRNLEYRPFAEIAERLQIDPDNARKLWKRAVRFMAKELKQQP